MIYGDTPQKISEREDALGLKAYTYAPQLTAVMQSGNLYVYCAGNPVCYIDADGNIALIAVAGVVLSIAFDGVITGLGHEQNGENFYAGFLNGAVSSAVSKGCTAAGALISSVSGGYIGAIVGGILGPAAGSFAEDYVFYKDTRSVEEIAESAAQAAAAGILSGIGLAYLEYAISIANEAGSVAQQLMEYDKDFGDALKVFFEKLISTLGALEGE